MASLLLRFDSLVYSANNSPYITVNKLTILINIKGVQQMLLSKATHNKSICQKKGKQQYISVGSVRMFIEPPVQCLGDTILTPHHCRDITGSDVTLMTSRVVTSLSQDHCHDITGSDITVTGHCHDITGCDITGRVAGYSLSGPQPRRSASITWV